MIFLTTSYLTFILSRQNVLTFNKTIINHDKDNYQNIRNENKNFIENNSKNNEKVIEITTFGYNYNYYDGYKSRMLNNFVSFASSPFDLLKFSISLPFVIFWNSIQYIWFSPSFIYFYGHKFLKEIDDWLVPVPEDPPN